MSSLYHILDKIPAVNKEEISEEYEQLAQELVASGRLRIDTDYYCNFTRYTDSSTGINLMLSIEELTDEKLLEHTKAFIKKSYSKQRKQINDSKANTIITQLKKDIKKLLPVDEQRKLELARIFVQSAHPIVIRWLLIDRTQIFITYSHNIGDVLDMSTWKTSGSNSGMQSTDGLEVCIYVSCGGDPFAQNSQSHPFQGDGWAALARLQIIAGQEIGHYADIIRDGNGRQLGRHSADFACTRATPNVKQGRRNDIKRCKELYKQLLNLNMDKLLAQEEKLKFYEKQKLSGLRVWFTMLLVKYHRYIFLANCKKKKLVFVKNFSQDRYIAIMLRAMIADMQANLSPEADVYKRSDPEAEEAISCVEALARVPQQVMKWGYLTTRATMHDLFKIYYGQVIPSLIDNYELYTGRKYKRNYHHPRKPALKTIITKLLFRKKEQVKFIPVRDV